MIQCVFTFCFVLADNIAELDHLYYPFPRRLGSEAGTYDLS